MFCVHFTRRLRSETHIVPLYKLISDYNIHTSTPLNVKESFLSGSSAVYIESLYQIWLENPKNVHVSWDSYFRSNSKNVATPYQPPPCLSLPPRNSVLLSDISTCKNTGSAESGGDKVLDEHLAVQAIIRSYQTRGHLAAKLDPLRIVSGLARENENVVRDYVKKHFTEKDMDRKYKLPATTYINDKDNKILPLKEILNRLEHTYCNHIGVEYMYIQSIKKCNWIREHIEVPGASELDKEQKRLILKRLTRAAGFELFLSKKWSAEKRFGLEGCEVLIPAMKQVIDVSSKLGVESIIIGMAHRGRLNVLSNVCRKSLKQLFTQFAGLEAADDGAGDVKYHLGTYIERMNRVSDRQIRLAVAANPSHLEAVDPIVQGRTRAEQFTKGDEKGKNIMSILVHGDASFAGQGVVFETMHLSALPAYTVHGTIHIVINNQVGFTTDPRFSRSSQYCTDVARVVNAPIFHVNGDSPEAVIHVCNVAAKWRATFHKDVVVDIVSYRRNGHNETDEPMFTQPLMYTKIRDITPIRDQYAEKLIKEGVVTAEEVKTYDDAYQKICEDEFNAAKKETHIKYKDWLECIWSGFFKNRDPLICKPTGVSESTLLHIGKHFSSPPNPPEFVIHKGIDRILKNRMAMIKSGKVDWACAEAMAFGSLLKEGIHVRLSGQDVERGTFSHRHHVLHHQTKDKVKYCPLAHLYPDQATYTVCNSSLSEFAVLGFEVGYSISSPNFLVCWEAQFGDFNNTAQCIIDQFVSSGQTKWVRQSGIVMLQPHGSEGMGPEHSSARLERFLSMSDDDPDGNPADSDDFEMKQIVDANWIVANCTTPANYFHILRRQIYFPFRKPLVLMTPKSLLRHPEAISTLSEMGKDTRFRRLIPEEGPISRKPENAKKLIFCTGKIYYDICKAREDHKYNDVIAVARIEQLSPFPFDLVKKELKKYTGAVVGWAQEEHKNQGGWGYIQPRLKTCMVGLEPLYIGRPASPSPSTGSKAAYIKEFQNLIAMIIAI